MERNVMGELNVYRGVRREAELQRNREEARHGPAHGRQVLEGGRVWIGNTYLDDSGRDSPSFLNSTGDM